MSEQRLRWNGSLEAQRQADAAFETLRDKPKKKRAKTAAYFAKQRRRNKANGRVQYWEYMRSGAWKRRKRKAFKHYGRVCAICGKTGGMLYVHHKSYKRLGNEPMEDLQILCVHCHEDQHADKVLSTDPVSKQFRAIIGS